MKAKDSVFQLVQVSTRTRLWLWLLAGVLPAAIAGSVFGHMAARGDLPPATALLAFGACVLPALLIGLAVDRLLRCHRLSLDRRGLRLSTSSYRRRLPLSELDLGRARVIDIDEHIEFRPRLKTNGASLPGFQSGWYRLRNGRRALVARAGGRRVLWIPTTRDFDLLLQPQQPRELLEALRAAAAAGTGDGACLAREEEKQYWFPAKQFGWGWGFPTAWQGWLVLGLYIAAVLALASTRPDDRTLYTWLVPLTAIVFIICFLKGEPPRWRWGDDDDD